MNLNLNNISSLKCYDLNSYIYLHMRKIKHQTNYQYKENYKSAYLKILGILHFKYS